MGTSLWRLMLSWKYVMKLVRQPGGLGAIFWEFLRLGLTAFGGPVAHLGYFREAFVRRLQWLDDRSFADLVAASQFLPGPASSKVGIGIGFARGGLRGAALAWLGFTLPSAVIMVSLGAGWAAWRGGLPTGLLHALKLVAVAVVAQAVLGMAKSLAPDGRRRCLALLAMLATFAFNALGLGAAGQLGVILGGALAGLAGLRATVRAELPPASSESSESGLSRRVAVALLVLFAALLAGSYWLSANGAGGELGRVADFYRTGALVFGGGHVALPLFAEFAIGPAALDEPGFLAGYALAQALPGPLFTFAGFLGAAMNPGPWAAWSGVLAVLAVFAPGALLILGVLPFWTRLRQRPGARAAVAGVNAAVLGLLAAALVNPVASGSIASLGDLLAAALGLALLVWARCPPWALVLGFGLVGALLR